MKITLTEIEKVIDDLAEAITYAKEARRVSKKVYGDEREIATYLKYAYGNVQRVLHRLEMKDVAE